MLAGESPAVAASNLGVSLGDPVDERLVWVVERPSLRTEERIYGDGVNIAARVQAPAEPDGVAISRATFDQVEEKLDPNFEDLGPLPCPIRNRG